MSNPIVRKSTTAQPSDGVIFAYDATNKTWDEVVATAGAGVTPTYADTTLTFALDVANLTTVTGVAGDFLPFFDVSDSNNPKKMLVSDIVSLASAGNTLYSADDTIAASRTVTIDAAKVLDFDITGTGSTTISDGGTAFVTFADGGTTTLTNDIAVNGGDVTTTATTASLFNTNATTVNIAGAGTTVSIGAGTGTTTINNANTIITGNLQVDGTTTTVNSTVVTIDDKDLVLASGGTTDASVNGAGIIIDATTDKSFLYNSTNTSFVSSEHLETAAGKDLILNGATSGAVTYAAAAATTDYTVTAPAVTGTAGQVMYSTDGASTMGWKSVADAPAISTKAAAYTLADTDSDILLNSTTALITLPDPSTLTAGKRFTITLIAATPTTAGVDTATAATISGSASYVFTAQHESITVLTDGTQYYLV